MLSETFVILLQVILWLFILGVATFATQLFAVWLFYGLNLALEKTTLIFEFVKNRIIKKKGQ